MGWGERDGQMGKRKQGRGQELWGSRPGRESDSVKGPKEREREKCCNASQACQAMLAWHLDCVYHEDGKLLLSYPVVHCLGVTGGEDGVVNAGKPPSMVST